MTQVWITGQAVVCPLGDTPTQLADALQTQRSGVRAYPGEARFGIAPYVAAAVERPLGVGWPQQQLALLDRTAQLGLEAALAAWADAGLARPEAGAAPSEAASRRAVAWGTGMGGTTTLDAAYVELLSAERPRIHPYTVVRSMANATAAHVAMSLQLQGPQLAVSNACASSAQAIGEAMQMIRSGRADVVLAGGSESMLVPASVRAWQAMGVLARPDAEAPPQSCRPFDRQRSGLVLGEGAGALVLESEAHARARGARPLAELAGYGCSCDATHLSRPDQAGQERAIRAALSEAALPPEAVGYINAHGTGTEVGDAVEAASIAAVFGAYRPAVSSSKALHGHLMGAGGAVELIAALQVLSRGVAPPSAHVRESDCLDLIDLVLGAPRPLQTEAVMSNAFAFGGTNVVLLARRVG
jgi:3-oxoacyl-(acyl-carrier-protein) synthase